VKKSRTEKVSQKIPKKSIRNGLTGEARFGKILLAVKKFGESNGLGGTVKKDEINVEN